MMRFEYQYEEGSPKVTIEIENADICLDELLPQMGGFLRACGYSFDGELITEEQEGK